MPALLEVIPPSLSDWACLTSHLSPPPDTVCALMSALCTNASVSHLLPYYSSNLIHKGAQVTLWGVTHRVCDSITSSLMYLSLLLLLMPHLPGWASPPLFHSLILLKNASYPCPWTLRPARCFIMWSLFLCRWSKKLSWALSLRLLFSISAAQMSSPLTPSCSILKAEYYSISVFLWYNYRSVCAFCLSLSVSAVICLNLTWLHRSKS